MRVDQRAMDGKSMPTRFAQTMGAVGAGVNNSGRLIYLDSKAGFCANGGATGAR
jgi:hypothetical protein